MEWSEVSVRGPLYYVYVSYKGKVKRQSECAKNKIHLHLCWKLQSELSFSSQTNLQGDMKGRKTNVK